MTDTDHSTVADSCPEDVNEDLRQALLRMTKPGSVPIQENLNALRQELLSIADAIHQAEEMLQQRDEELSQQDRELYSLIQEVSFRQAKLEVYLQGLEDTYRVQRKTDTSAIEAKISGIRDSLSSPEQNAERMSPLLVPLLRQSAREDNVRFAEAVAPVIGPAIRHQIRDAKQDIIDALFPLIGQIISKAIAEAIRELTRNIDARIRQQRSIGSRLRHLLARAKGVSEAEITLRDALPYQINRVFLVHRETGLLLEQISLKEEIDQEELNVISSMLTAIRDFVHDAFADPQGDLEEITYGDQRILLEPGQNAYLAVALTGVEPLGYHQRIRKAVSKINIDHEEAIRNFGGDVQALPNFKPDLLPILFPEHDSEKTQEIKALSRNQKIAVGATVFGLLFLLVFLSFACLFTVRLWPLVFH